jgi:molybdate transport system substrate-binding protein
MLARLRLWSLGPLLAIGLVTATCGGDRPPPEVFRVLAASSLTDAFGELGDRFEAEHPDVDVTFTFAASSALARQVNDGAPSDVLVTADGESMARVVDAGGATGPTTIARNRLAIVVGPGNPKGITGLADLGRRGVVFVVCAPEVPCGRLAARALRLAGVTAAPASLEENVRAVVAKVMLDEADAGIAYSTDVRVAGDGVDGVELDAGSDPDLEAVYLAATTQQAASDETAETWIDYLLSDEAQRILVSNGFLAP